MTMPRVEAAVTELLNAHRGPAATALMHWLITGDHVHGEIPVDIGWLPPGVPGPVI